MPVRGMPLNRIAEAGNLKVKPATVKKGGVVWEVSGSALNDKYRDFLKACAVVRNDRLLDSLDALFFAARDREDRELSRLLISL